MKPLKSLSALATALIAGSHVVNAIEVDLTSTGMYLAFISSYLFY